MQLDCVHYIGNATGNVISRRFPLLAPPTYLNAVSHSERWIVYWLCVKHVATV